jgi:multidrug efflux pump subunit AcrA (membrane-fusion protein)
MIKARLSDQFASKVKKGDKVSLYFPDLDKELSSALSYVGQTVNASSRTINVEAKLPPAKEKFITNQIVKLKINDGIQKSVIVVPSNVIQKSINGEDYILVVENKNGIMYAKKQIVKTGQQYNGQTVILEGLKSGDNYITLGYTEIVDGQTIQN